MKKTYFFSLAFLSLFQYQTSLRAESYFTSSENLQPSHCPSISEIFHNPAGNRWKSGAWLGSEVSFEKKLIAFKGAQWVGANIGKMICVYKGASQEGFPVTIQNTQLIPSPTSSNWGKYEHGRKNCPPYPTESSVSIYDCPFSVPKPKPKENIYETLKTFKQRK